MTAYNPRQMVVELPEAVDYEYRGWTYYRTVAAVTLDNGPLTMDGRITGDTETDEIHMSVGPEGARIDWCPKPGAYTAGSMYAIGVLFLAAAQQQATVECVKIAADQVLRGVDLDFDADHQPTPGEMT